MGLRCAGETSWGKDTIESQAGVQHLSSVYKADHKPHYLPHGKRRKNQHMEVSLKYSVAKLYIAHLC